MKKNIKNMLLSLSIVLVTSTALLAQGPPDPPEDPGDGGGPVGGSAPIDSGIGILLTLGAAYGTRKVYKAFKEKDELEN
jgi:hypothetical protein